MHHQEFPPPEELQYSIKCFWYNSREADELQPNFEVVPDGYAEIIFHFGIGFSIVHNDGLQPLLSPFLIGLLNQPVVFHTKTRLEIIGIRCFSWTVFDLLGLQPGKDGIRIFEHPITQLQSSLSKCIENDRIDNAISLVKQYFLDARLQVANDGTLSKAGMAMTGANGKMPVNQVAAAAHATVRTLERKFKQSSGYSVKDVSGFMRFEQVRNKLWEHPEANIARLAHELGYADQSHLSKEFKRYSGTTPAAFARKTKKERQELSGDFVAFI